MVVPRPTRPIPWPACVGLAGWAVACATYEPAPLRQQDGAEAGGTAGVSSGAGHAGTPAAVAGASPRPSGGGAGVAAFGGSSAAGSGGSGVGGQLEVAGAAGEEALGAGGVAGGLLRSWTFDSGADGWTIREQSPELGVALVEAAGALQLDGVPFSVTKQFVDLAFELEPPADLRGRTLRATVQRTAGGFVGAQLYVYGGQWVSPGFESLSSGDVTVLSLPLDQVSDAGFTAASIGIKLSTGSNEANVFGATSLELTEVTLD